MGGMNGNDTTITDNGKDNDDEDGEMDSADEALLSMLGLTDLDVKVEEENEEEPYSEDSSSHLMPLADVERILQSTTLISEYKKNGFCVFPSSLKLSPSLMRRLTDELVWGGDSVQADKTYETIKLWKSGEVIERRTLTRLENFVDNHEGWKELCHGHLKRCISALLGQEMVLFKEKLNLKPPGGSGFAPHLDGPSLRVALGEDGPKSFVTVLVAIDSMTSQNGCLRVCKGHWTDVKSVEVIQPESDGNPDAGGRAGAIPATVVDLIEFEDLSCDGGSIAAFSEWTPHRSAANTSPFPRRAVFLTYNPASEGDHHTKYYEKMEALRNEWRSKIGLADRSQLEEDHQRELDAFATVPM